MPNNFESKFESKKEKKPKLMFVFDIDGVITNPDTKEPNKKIIERIGADLNQELPVALITGRSINWIENNIMPILKTTIENNQKLDLLFTSGEKGSVSVEYVNGEPVKKIDENIMMPVQLMSEVKKIIQPYTDFIFYDETKETMISIEIKGGEDDKKIEKQKEVLFLIGIQLKKIIENFDFKDLLKIDLTEIAVDLQFKSQSKKISTRHILDWLKGKNINPFSYIVIGDSPSDAEAAEEFFTQGCDITFGYVGKKNIQKQPFKTKIASEYFDQGTLEILDEVLKDKNNF